MRFLVDNQLPIALAKWLLAKGFETDHVLDIGLDSAPDTEIWNRGIAEDRIVVSKDEDFFHLANRPRDRGRLLWIRLGNCRTVALIARFEIEWPRIESAFGGGNRIAMLL